MRGFYSPPLRYSNGLLFIHNQLPPRHMKWTRQSGRQKATTSEGQLQVQAGGIPAEQQFRSRRWCSLRRHMPWPLRGTGEQKTERLVGNLPSTDVHLCILVSALSTLLTMWVTHKVSAIQTVAQV